VQAQKVRVLSEDDAAFLQGKYQVLFVAGGMQTCFLRRDYIYTPPPQARRDRSGDMLVHIESDAISHRSSRSASMGCGFGVRR